MFILKTFTMIVFVNLDHTHAKGYEVASYVFGRYVIAGGILAKVVVEALHSFGTGLFDTLCGTMATTLWISGKVVISRVDDRENAVVLKNFQTPAMITAHRGVFLICDHGHGCLYVA